MPTVVAHSNELRDVLRRRRELGHDKFDEVWNGVYVMNAMPGTEHQRFVQLLAFALQLTVPANASVLPGVNVSDRDADWTSNFRCPDVVVYLASNPAIDHGTHWRGGPDLAVEVISAGDRARKKLGFYSQVGTREVLLIDPRRRTVQLYTLRDGQLVEVARSCAGDPALASTVVPLSFAFVAADSSHCFQIQSSASDQTWTL